MWDAAFPVEIGASGTFEMGHNLAEFRVNGSAVVTLVIVLHDDFPIRGHIIDNLLGSAKLGQWIATEKFRNASKLEEQLVFGELVLICGKVYKNKTTPCLEAHWIKRKLLLREVLGFREEGSTQKLSIQVISPLVVRTANRPRGSKSASQLLSTPFLFRCHA